DHAVVGGGVFEGLQRQVEALGIGEAAFGQICQHAVVVACVDHDGNITVVLGRRTDHGRAANVDVLDGIGQRAIGTGHGGCEGIEIDHHHVDGIDAVLGHHCAVPVTAAENAAVDLRMQRLDPPVHHFGEAGVIGHFHGVDTVIPQQLVGTAGRENFHSPGAEFTG